MPIADSSPPPTSPSHVRSTPSPTRDDSCPLGFPTPPPPPGNSSTSPPSCRSAPFPSHRRSRPLHLLPEPLPCREHPARVVHDRYGGPDGEREPPRERGGEPLGEDLRGEQERVRGHGGDPRGVPGPEAVEDVQRREHGADEEPTHGVRGVSSRTSRHPASRFLFRHHGPPPHSLPRPPRGLLSLPAPLPRPVFHLYMNRCCGSHAPPRHPAAIRARRVRDDGVESARSLFPSASSASGPVGPSRALLICVDGVGVAFPCQDRRLLGWILSSPLLSSTSRCRVLLALMSRS
ncbi:formin-like protein 20 [Triticum aestivum]|uniref:formin-like protein 20 n=1 Tax=Triticum aestivum TaxID=4565 RepID=UPI001D0328A3|nr:formin-like protein 20 [Triticum aestivum]